MPSATEDHDDKPTSIAAVDFGTTFSVLCWVLASNVRGLASTRSLLTGLPLDKPRMVTNWPSYYGTEVSSGKIST